MATTLPDRAAARLPERAERLAKAALPSLRKAEGSADRQARRAVLGGVLEGALVILRLTRLKDQTTFIGKGLGRKHLDDRQVARWLNGSEPAPWEELLAIRDLQWPLFQALFESCETDLVDIETTIRRRQPKAVAS